MKAFLAIVFFALATPTVYGDELLDRIASIPNPHEIDNTWVSDPAGVIANRRADINQMISALERETSAQIAVVVLPTIGKLVPKDFAVGLIEKWGIGKSGKDNGVLVLHILDQRRIEIETGYGMEGILPDIKCFWITDEVAVPFFKKDSLADGHYEAVRALVRAIQNPNITHEDLVSQVVTQPGATTDDLPSIDTHDEIAMRYASPTEKIIYGKWTPLVLIALGGIFYVVISVLNWKRSRGKEPYAKYKLYSSGFSRLQYVSTLPVAASALVFENARTDTFFSPLPVLLALGLATLRHRSKKLKALRNEPRTCQCGKQMHRLNEQQDDAYIEKGNVAEESIGSVDYDVWVCDCGQSAIESYKGKTPAAVCSQCRYRTYRVTNTVTLSSATTSSTGLREITYTCANCGYKKVTTEVIPKISTSSSGSGSSSSRSSGSSFGGGRSGGGGAGSSY